MSNQALNDDAWTTLAKSLDVEAATLKAVATVEAAGSGFLPKDPTRPKILFEGHAFHRLTGGKFAELRPDLSYPKWDKKKYSGSLKGEWDRLEAACALDRPAALQSASFARSVCSWNCAKNSSWMSASTVPNSSFLRPVSRTSATSPLRPSPMPRR